MYSSTIRDQKAVCVSFGTTFVVFYNDNGLLTPAVWLKQDSCFAQRETPSSDYCSTYCYKGELPLELFPLVDVFSWFHQDSEDTALEKLNKQLEGYPLKMKIWVLAASIITYQVMTGKIDKEFIEEYTSNINLEKRYYKYYAMLTTMVSDYFCEMGNKGTGSTVTKLVKEGDFTFRLE